MNYYWSMDYENVYRTFIALRTLSGPPDGYSEQHHIIPVAHGGTDAAQNLIRLSARDHYFAHCCLARIYGGKMWSALALMGLTQKAQHGAPQFSKGRMFDIARRESARVRSENMTALWASGEFKRNRVYGPASEKQKRAASESGRKARPGRKDEAAKMVATKQAKAPVFEFVDLATGEIFEGTGLQFRKRSGASQSHTSAMLRGRVEAVKGWVLRGNEHKPRGNHDHTVRVFRHRDGRVFEGTARDFNAAHIKDSGMLSNCINGKNRVKTARGWTYVGEK